MIRKRWDFEGSAHLHGMRGCRVSDHPDVPRYRDDPQQDVAGILKGGILHWLVGVVHARHRLAGLVTR